MRTRLSFLAICSLLLSLLTTTTPANSFTANLEIIAATDTKPGEVELTFISKISNKRSYQIIAKPKFINLALFIGFICSYCFNRQMVDCKFVA